MNILERAISLLILSGFFRNLGMLIVFPLPENVVGISMRLGIAMALTLPLIDFTYAEVPYSVFWLVLELIIGLLLGIPLLVGHQALRMWGDLFETLRGHQLGLVIDPMSGGEEQPFALLLSSAVSFCLYSNCLFPLLIGVSIHSLAQLPPAQLSLALASELAQSTLYASQTILSATLITLLPFAAIILGVELAAMIISKVTSGISLSSESYLCRMILVLGLLLVQPDRLLTHFVALTTNLLPMRP